MRLSLLALLAVIPPRPSLASTEDFSTFDVESQEEDDESLLDHFQTRYPLGWQEEWARIPQGLRTSQGCFTSGQWFLETEARLSAPVGRSSRFGFAVRQEMADDIEVEQIDLTWWRQTARFGKLGALFRPFHDKSQQDFAALWAAGSDTSRLQIDAAFTLEDMFNNFWAFRQRRVGERSEPYLARPYEPALHGAWRSRSLAVEAQGRWLTPSSKSVVSLAQPDSVADLVTLWGAEGSGSLRIGGADRSFSVSTWNKQARSSRGPQDGNVPGADYRRQWRVEGLLRGRLGSRWSARAHWLYGERLQRYTPASQPTFFFGVDRLIGAAAEWRFTPAWLASAGLLHSRLGVDQRGPMGGRIQSQGTRSESRAFVGVEARFGDLLVSASEGFELDRERYEVWFVHDKAFFQIQAKF